MEAARDTDAVPEERSLAMVSFAEQSNASDTYWSELNSDESDASTLAIHSKSHLKKRESRRADNDRKQTPQGYRRT